MGLITRRDVLSRRLAQSEALRFSHLRRVARAILTPIMPAHRRHFHPGQLQFITTSTYRCAKLFESDRFRRDFVKVLQQLRQEMGFRLVGWVLMPEHFHLLIKPEPAERTSGFMQEQVAQSCSVTLRHFVFGILEVRVVARA